MATGPHIPAVVNWLQARHLERDKAFAISGTRYSADAPPREMTETELRGANVSLAEFHDFLQGIGAPIAETVRYCELAGWLRERAWFNPPDEIPQPLRHGDGRRCYAIQNAVLLAPVATPAAELQAATLPTPAANLGRELFAVASWPLWPFADRPQRLPTEKAQGLVTFSGRQAQSWMPPPSEPTHITGTATPGGTIRMERAGVAVELYFPTDTDRATLAAALANCDLDAPPWHAVQTRLVEAGLSADWTNLTAPAAVAMLARTTGTRQSEGTGTKPEGTKPPAPGGANEPPTDDGTNRYAALDDMEPAHRLAFLSYLYAVAMRPAEAKGRRLTRPDAWQWLFDHKDDGYGSGELAEYADKLPNYDTWESQERRARKATGERIYTPRTAKTPGGSIVLADELTRQDRHAE